MSDSNGNGHISNTQDPPGALPPEHRPHIPTEALTDNEYRREEQRIVLNMLSTRADLVRRLTDPQRDLYTECGFPKGEISLQDYQHQYERNPYAARVVEVMAKEAWRVQPTIYEDEDGETPTALEETWDHLSQQLRGEQSYYKDEYGNLVMNTLYAATVLSGIGRYGVIIIGLKDDDNLEQPAEFKPGPTATRELSYLTVFPESYCQVSEHSTTPGPRYGHPEYYTVTFPEQMLREISGSPGTYGNQVKVHYTRVVHVPLGDEESSSRLYHPPRQQVCFNNLLTLEKLGGASGEMFYRGAFMGLAFSTHPNLGASAKINVPKTKEMMENYQWGLQRWLGLEGMDVTPLAPQVSDPTGQINVQIEAICIKKEIPVRIFKGSERGELASSQDDDTWLARVEAYQWNKITPQLLIPFVDRLINLNVLPMPTEGYSIEWPSMRAEKPSEEASLASQNTSTLVAYDGSGLKDWYTELDFLTRVMGMEDDDANAVIENGIKAKDKKESESAADGGPLLDDAAGLQGMIKLFEDAKAGALSEEQLKQIIMLFFKVDEATADEIIADGIPEPPPPPTPVIVAHPGAVPPKPGQPPIPGQPKPAVNPVVAATGAKVPAVPTQNELERMWDYEDDGPLANAGKKLSGGHWVTTEGGAHVYLKGGKVVAGNPHVVQELGKPGTGKKGKKVNREKEATAKAREHLKAAHEADKSGDHEKARHLRAASIGYHKAAEHHANGNHAKAEAVKKVADQYASGEKKLGEKKAAEKSKEPDKPKEQPKPVEKKAETVAPASEAQVKELHDSLAAKMPNLPEKHYEALDTYTSGAYQTINSALRSGKALTPEDRGYKDFQHIVDAIGSAPTLKDPVTVHRGLGLDQAKGQAFLDKMRELAKGGGTVEDPAFMSSTINPKIAHDWVQKNQHGTAVKVVMDIKATKGLYIGKSVGGSKEMEFLMQKGTKLKIHGVEERDGVHIIKAEQIHG